jgi:hypothetical protein
MLYIEFVCVVNSLIIKLLWYGDFKRIKIERVSTSLLARTGK